jgi:hypothetical protein
MKIPNDIWHEPLLIETASWYDIDRECRLWWDKNLKTYLENFYPEVYKYLKKKKIPPFYEQKPEKKPNKPKKQSIYQKIAEKRWKQFENNPDLKNLKQL